MSLTPRNFGLGMESEEAKRKSGTCFVVGPIGSDGSQTRIDADFLLQGIVREALTGLNLKIWRADEDSRPGMITDKVISDINDSDLVIADLSELNPNVFYELGIRHAAAKPTIHVAAAGTKLPFDNFGHRVVFFDKGNWNSVISARQRLADQAKEALEKDFEVSNPVTQALSAKAFRAKASPSEKIVAELMKRVETLEALPRTSLAPRPAPQRESLDPSSEVEKVLDAKYKRMEALRTVALRLAKDYGPFTEEMLNSFPDMNSDPASFRNIIEALRAEKIDYIVDKIRASEIPF